MNVPPQALLQAIRAEGVTIADAQRCVAKMLEAADFDTPQLDARLLLAAATGETAERLILDAQRRLSASEAEQLVRFAERRWLHEPVSRILGERSFYGRTFQVTPDTLDPRPDTETLIDLALELLGTIGARGVVPDIADIGTGTGAILLTLLAELPDARGLGTDISRAALDVARQNAVALGVAERATWHQGRSVEGLPGTFDLLVSNPPYIPSGDIAGLGRDVRQFDPRLALDGGVDGLDIVREIVAGATSRVRTGGWCILEVGSGQAAAVIQHIEYQCGFSSPSHRARVARDLGGHERCVAWQPHV